MLAIFSAIKILATACVVMAQLLVEAACYSPDLLGLLVLVSTLIWALSF